jgi:hypothetical protein
METVTISRVGQPKEVETKFGKKTKTGVQFKEHGEVWHDVWVSDLKVGQTLQGERVSRDWEGKTYWNFNLAKKDDRIDGKLEEILIKIGMLNLKVEKIFDRLPVNKNSVISSYPEETINPDDIPF